jgi:hypothetical protein
MVSTHRRGDAFIFNGLEESIVIVPGLMRGALLPERRL